MAINILREVSRDGGRLPQSNGTSGAILSGMVLELANNGLNVQLSTSVSPAPAAPWGLAAESNVQQPLQGPGGLTVGVGYDYTNFDRGGLISVFQNGGSFELFNDQGELAPLSPSGGNPFVYTDSFASNNYVYAQANTGLVTATASGNSAAIGTCISVTNAGSAADMVLQIKLSI
jgi:hypothetical protein